MAKLRITWIKRGLIQFRKFKNTNYIDKTVNNIMDKFIDHVAQYYKYID